VTIEALERTSARSPPPPITSKFATSSASKSRPITRPRWSCCTTPAIRSMNGFLREQFGY